ncbi:hypothetical protein FB451DRAFT_1411031 [Mycena latifolia]|nr:hypothetical protein FB451DRAFT_1411031 [Mycena latifolia]
MAGASSWLSRARSRTLSLWIFFFHSISANPIGEIVAPLQSRIGLLQVTSAPIGCLQSLLDFPTDSFPLLHTLTIEFPPPHFTWARKSDTSSAPRIFPQLEDFAVSAGWTVLNIQHMPINWDQLTTLHVEKAGTSLPSLCSILAHCTSLTTCSLAIRESALPPGRINVRPTALTRLSTLNLQLLNGFDYFLAHFTFPALSTVLLSRSTESSTPTATARMLASLASPTLRRLAMRIPCDPDGLLALLGGAPDLQELHMLFDRRVISILTLSAQFVPRLTFITCILPTEQANAGGVHAAERKEFADMIMTRWRSPDVIRPRAITVLPNAYDGWDVVMDRLSDAVAEGLLVQVRAGDDLSFSSD